MLIYDHTKTFIGLDEEDLRLLGFATGEELSGACSDIAEFFVKKPGYIHDFKNFEWIDFVLHAESENSKAIVDTGRKSFSCDISIKPFYLLQSPDNAAYAVTFNHIKPLSASEQASISAMPAAAATPEPTMPPPAPPKVEAVTPPPVQEEPPTAPVQLDELPSFDDVAETTLNEPETFDIPADTHLDDPYDKPDPLYPDFDKPLEIEDDIFLSPESDTPSEAPATFETDSMMMDDELLPPDVAPTPESESAPKERPMLGDYLTQDEQEFAKSLDEFKDYHYDPHIAADELGLPVDLIEEFIGDFIHQAHDFKDEMFEAASKEDFDNLKLLSHKLKGVAANLRIEDAFAMLSTVNTSHDQIEIEANLKLFYNTIAKLEGKEPLLDLAATPEPEALPEVEAPTLAPEPELDTFAAPEPAPAPASDDDLYDFSIKDTTTTPEASPAPQTDDDDLYDFSIKDTSAPEASTPTPDTSDLYDFDLPDTTAPLAPEAADPEPFNEPSMDAYEPEPAPVAPEPAFDAFEPEPEPVIPEADLNAYEPEPELPLDMGNDLTPPSAAPTPEATPAPAFMPYDSNKAAMELGLPLDVVTDLKEDFVTYATTTKEEIVNAVAANDASVWRHAATRFKGIAGNLRMNELAPLLQELETTSDPMEAERLAARFYDYVATL